MTTESAVPAPLPPPWRVLTEFGYFAGLAAVLGGTLTYLAVVRPAPGVAAARAVAVLRTRAARLLAGCGAVLLVTSYGQLAARVARAEPHPGFAAALSPARIAGLLAAGPAAGQWVSPNRLTAVQNGVYLVVALLLVTLPLRDPVRRLDRTAAAALALMVLGTLSPSLPTRVVGADSLVNGALDELHIVAAATWLGGLFVLSVLSRAGRELGSVYWARAWQRFSTVALVAVGCLVTSGLWLGWKHVGAPGQLVDTPYGRFLLVKLCIVALMVTAGAYNQLVLTPRAARAHAEGDLTAGAHLALRHFPRAVTAEVALGCCVLLIVPFLSGSARTQAGGPPAPKPDLQVLGTGAVLVALLAASLYSAHRVSTLLVRRARPGLDTAG
jgi:copper transport protein